MKTDERQRSIELRQTGKSIREIEADTGYCRSSISRWVKNVVLTKQQKTELENRNPAYNGQFKGGHVVSEKWARLRKDYREEGCQTASKKEPTHVAACMLYWAEGMKSQNQVRITNSDPNVLKLFLTFARKYFGIGNEEIRLTVNCYTDIHNVYDIEQYWLRQLDLPRSCLRKGTINYFSRYSQNKKKGKCEYGTCALGICKGVRIIQHIYGAIEAYQTILE